MIQVLFMIVMLAYVIIDVLWKQKMEKEIELLKELANE